MINSSRSQDSFRRLRSGVDEIEGSFQLPQAAGVPMPGDEIRHLLDLEAGGMRQRVEPGDRLPDSAPPAQVANASLPMKGSAMPRG